MPYPNEHSARLRKPGDFDDKSFRRTDVKEFRSKKSTKTFSVIWAKLKGKTKKSDPAIAQALRFPIDNWTEKQARAWLKKEPETKFILFEPATKEKNISNQIINKLKERYGTDITTN